VSWYGALGLLSYATPFQTLKALIVNISLNTLSKYVDQELNGEKLTNVNRDEKVEITSRKRRQTKRVICGNSAYIPWRYAILYTCVIFKRPVVAFGRLENTARRLFVGLRRV